MSTFVQHQGLKLDHDRLDHQVDNYDVEDDSSNDDEEDAASSP